MSISLAAVAARRGRTVEPPIVNQVRNAPLPVRDGLNPSRIRLPESGPWATILDYLLQRFYTDQVRVQEKVAAGEVVDAAGTPIEAQTPFDPDSFVFLYRDPAPERRVPFEIEIIYRDSDLLVIDKPHFLATMPPGSTSWSPHWSGCVASWSSRISARCTGSIGSPRVS